MKERYFVLNYRHFFYGDFDEWIVGIEEMLGFLVKILAYFGGLS